MNEMTGYGELHSFSPLKKFLKSIQKPPVKTVILQNA